MDGILRYKSLEFTIAVSYTHLDLQKETLRETGIQNCDVVVVCIGDKVDVSILTTLNVINLGVPQVVAKANSPEQGEILEKIGAQVVRCV